MNAQLYSLNENLCAMYFAEFGFAMQLAIQLAVSEMGNALLQPY